MTLVTDSSRQPAPAVPTLRERNRHRFWLVEFYGSAIGKKAVMAVTGIVLLGFVLVHMLGNLKIYTGETHLDAYGAYLREIGEPILPHTGFLWILRVGLILAFIFHIHAAYSLTVINRKARKIGYKGGRDYVAANYAARTMRWSGVIVGFFVLFHLMDITWGYHVVHPGFERGAPYHNLVQSFSVDRWPVAVIYIIANILLGIHIFHGAWSLFQSLGWNNPRFNRWRRYFAIGFAAVIVIGNVSIPIAVLTGAVS
jgi:succinate dehydrogenase / fumarate reductase cytochrome b subunit